MEVLKNFLGSPLDEFLRNPWWKNFQMHLWQIFFKNSWTKISRKSLRRNSKEFYEEFSIWTLENFLKKYFKKLMRESLDEILIWTEGAEVFLGKSMEEFLRQSRQNFQIKNWEVSKEFWEEFPWEFLKESLQDFQRKNLREETSGAFSKKPWRNFQNKPWGNFLFFFYKLINFLQSFWRNL